MILTISLSILLWLFFLLKGNKMIFFKLLPTCYIAALLNIATDLLVTYYPLWKHPDLSIGEIMIRHTIMAFGIYFMTTYLFLQWLPTKRTFLSMVKYISYWVIYSLIIEVIFLSWGEIQHGLWWNLWYSILSDFLLFSLFFFHHNWFTKHS